MDISRIQLEDDIYNLKDAEAREILSTLRRSLGDLAYKDSASGTYTPEGNVSAPNVTINPRLVAINTVKSIGSLPNWVASVENEVLSFAFNKGSRDVLESVQVMNGVNSVTVTTPDFTGVTKNITVS